MGRSALVLALALTGAGACNASPQSSPQDGAPAKAATAPTSAAALFADAAGAPRLDRAAQPVTLSDGGKVELSSWRFEPAPGRSELRNSYMCGVQVAGQTLTVIGVGETETVSCDGLSAAGPVLGGRIGLIYRTSSPNASGVSAVVLARAGGAWSLDEAATATLTSRSPANLAELNKALGGR